LNLWDYLLTIIDDLTTEERITSLDVIVRFLSRRTFDPLYMDGNEKEEISIGFFTKPIQKFQITSKYKKLLYKTYQFVILKLQNTKELSEKPEWLSFAASVLGFYFCN
jgi:hypothetical protein